MVAEFRVEDALVGLVVAVLLLAAGQRWAERTIEDATGGLLDV